ncbi:MAG: DUF512 domain-containing protein [Clostridiales bacterium]|nr:DUF512 domain-containing protein [Clostridiales bacterium]
MRRISFVQSGSLAERHRISPGDILLAINGEPVLDEIDYQALTAARYVQLTLTTVEGTERNIKIVKPVAAPLGLQFDDSLIGNPRTCGNQCVFCFVDQMPKGMRESLYVKDDDWRLSLLMGNYITLTNVGEREFSRILKRKASPLYISVHATDMELRKQILGNRHGGLLLERLQRLKDHGLSFHAQLVLCPGLNDGEHLEKSLYDLMGFAPNALSVAVVPVGLTRHRDGLPPIRPYTREEALDVLDICARFQEKALQELGTRFAFVADEFISIADREIPEDGYYEHYAQIENGIGMLRQFEEGLRTAAQETADNNHQENVQVLLPCGSAVFPYLCRWVEQYLPQRIQAQVVAVKNDFFGDSVTVTGLLVGRDLVNQLKGHSADAVFICETMLNSDGALFLDDMTPERLQNELGMPVHVFPNDGEAFYHTIVSIQPAIKEKP